MANSLSLSQMGSDVRISELDLSTTITQVANVTAMQVVTGSQGRPFPLFFSTGDDYLEEYGTPNARVSFDHYCALDYFKEGNSFWGIRVAGAGALWSAAVVKSMANGATVIDPITSGIKDPNDVPFGNYVSSGEQPLFLVHALRGQGSYGNDIAVKILSNNLDTPTGLAAQSNTTGGYLAAATYNYQVAAIGQGGTETVSTTPVSITIASATSTNVVNLTWNPVANAIGYKIFGRVGSTVGLLSTVGGTTLEFQDDGSYVVVPDQEPITSPAGLGAPSTVFTVQVFDLNWSASTPRESFACSLDDRVDETGVQMEITSRINPYSRYIQIESNLQSLMTTPVIRNTGAPVALAGGASGSAPTSADITNALKAFADKDRYKIDVLINSGRSTPAVQRALDSFAAKRNDCVAFLDMPPGSQQAQASVDYRNLTLNLNSSYSALFTPDLYEIDPINGKYLYVPPSGAMAGLMARTTRVSQPWFSMAGLNRGLLDVLDVRHSYEDGERTLLFQSQVNYTRKFVGKGIPLWEQATLHSASSALQFLNVRVLCNVIKRAVYQYLIYGLQEPNDEILKRQLQFGLKQYLDTVKQARGIKDYKVVINDSNNPPALANAGILNIIIYIIPILPVRQINLTLAIGKQGLEITESELAALAG